MRYFRLSIPILYCLFFILCQCTSDTSSVKFDPGKELYQKYCKNCHGTDGSLGLADASNLKVSILSEEETYEVITNGRGVMQRFSEMLTDKEREQLVNYAISLRNN